MDAGEVLGWPFRDPRWPARILGMGAIWLLLSLTIVGAIPALIALNGWMLQCLDNLRGGRLELARPGLPLRRGARLFLVQLVYLAVIVAVTTLLTAAGVQAAKAGGPAAIGGGLLVILANALSLLGSLALVVLLPEIALLIERRGLPGGFALPAILRMARSAGSTAILTGLLSLLALDIISPLGLLLCLVGVAATTPYAMAVLAAAIHGLEELEGESHVSAAG